MPDCDGEKSKFGVVALEDAEVGSVVLVMAPGESQLDIAGVP